MKNKYFLMAFVLGFLAVVTTVQAQTIDPETDRINGEVEVIDAVTLRSKDYLIKVWGVKSFLSSDVSTEIRGRDALQRLIANSPVNCRVMAISKDRKKLVGRCGVGSGEDIGLHMVQNGYAIVDRAAIYGTRYAETYQQAESVARKNQNGLWASFREDSATQNLPPWLVEHLPTFVPLGLLIVPLVGLFLVALFMKRGLRRIEKQYQEAFAETRAQEESLADRERAVLASALEGELIDNVNKIDAFTTIYKEMLKDLEDTSKPPSYQAAEELVHQRPALSRVVFDANVDRLSVFEMKLGSDIAKLYVSVSSEPEYQMLNQKTPLSTAKGIVKDIITGAEELKADIEELVGRLHAISSKYAATQQIDVEDQFDFSDTDEEAPAAAEIEEESDEELVARAPGHPAPEQSVN